MLQKYAILAFLSFVWGTTWIAIKYSLIGIPPFLGASARFLVALACLLGYAAHKRRSLKISSKDFSMIFISSILLYLLDYGLIYWGEQYINAGATAIFLPHFRCLRASFPISFSAARRFSGKNFWDWLSDFWASLSFFTTSCCKRALKAWLCGRQSR